ncbi:hypothetical protein BDZ91DRAFT_324072 [Kalaharituber pfeilii]|nr:hypothetical protein BDZ91DRAFT_324072 [Kalaharituber pfeilii]
MRSVPSFSGSSSAGCVSSGMTIGDVGCVSSSMTIGTVDCSLPSRSILAAYACWLPFIVVSVSSLSMRSVRVGGGAGLVFRSLPSRSLSSRSILAVYAYWLPFIVVSDSSLSMRSVSISVGMWLAAFFLSDAGAGTAGGILGSAILPGVITPLLCRISVIMWHMFLNASFTESSHSLCLDSVFPRRFTDRVDDHAVEGLMQYDEFRL